MSGETNLNPLKEEILWFMLPPEEVEHKLNTSMNSGLSSSEIENRVKQFGLNELQKETKTPRWKVFLQGFNDPLIYILIGAAIISMFLKEVTDAITIIVIVIINAIIGFITEGKADSAIEALKKISSPETVVLRDGNEKKIKTEDIVPGDIIIIHEGDKIPADARLFEISNFKVEEAALTGESVPVTEKFGHN